jgi:hypothetical protein
LTDDPVSSENHRHGRLAQLAEHRPHMPGWILSLDAVKTPGTRMVPGVSCSSGRVGSGCVAAGKSRVDPGLFTSSDTISDTVAVPGRECPRGHDEAAGRACRRRLRDERWAIVDIRPAMANCSRWPGRTGRVNWSGGADAWPAPNPRWPTGACGVRGGWTGPRRAARSRAVVSVVPAARTSAAGSPRGPAPRSVRVATSRRPPAPGDTPWCSRTMPECGACAQAAIRAGAGARHACA